MLTISASNSRISPASHECDQFYTQYPTSLASKANILRLALRACLIYGQRLLISLHLEKCGHPHPTNVNKKSMPLCKKGCAMASSLRVAYRKC